MEQRPMQGWAAAQVAGAFLPPNKGHQLPLRQWASSVPLQRPGPQLPRGGSGVGLDGQWGKDTRDCDSRQRDQGGMVVWPDARPSSGHGPHGSSMQVAAKLSNCSSLMAWPKRTAASWMSLQAPCSPLTAAPATPSISRGSLPGAYMAVCAGVPGNQLWE